MGYRLGSDRKQRPLHSSWHRGSTTNYTPSKKNMAEKQAIERYILHGWVPKAPPIKPGSRIVAIGSCFAMHIAEHLRKSKLLRVNDGDPEINLFIFGDGFVNTFTLRNQFEWALGLRELDVGVLSVRLKNAPRGAESVGTMQITPKIRAASKAAIESADAFILTLGLSEVWRDRATGEVFFGAIPKEKFDPARHYFEVSTVEENLANLRALYLLLRRTRPRAPIIFTLSPVPLTATFRPISCLTANSASKAILRVAIDDLMRERQAADPLLFYWPSYEIVLERFGLAGFREDRRHIEPKVLAVIMGLFERYFVAKT